MFYDLDFEKLTGEPLSLSDYKGKVVLISNTASSCGFTNQYGALEELWQKYKDKGLIVIGVPTNDFGNQEPLNNEEIGNFCQINYGVTFPVTKKVAAKGSFAHPFFSWIKNNYSFLAVPRWNFYKYLIDKEGRPLGWFTPFCDPLSPKITTLIEENLK